MTDYLDRAIAHLGVDKGSVIKSRQEDDVFIVIVDRGIAGCPKYRIPLSQLAELEPVPVAVKPGTVDAPSAEMPYRDLQVLARAAGIPANQSGADLRAALAAEDEEE